MSRIIDMSGKTFNRLTVISRNGSDRFGQSLWKCLCSCGNITTVTGYNIRKGRTKSCGCFEIENKTKHGKSGTKVYSCWEAMWWRCTNPNSVGYSNYGGRGISVCDEWKDFSNFYEDMGDCPEGMSLDRIDVNGNYCKENCRWADNSTQSFNRRMSDANTSGVTGVSWSKAANKWQAKINVGGKEVWLGVYNSFEKAVQVRRDAEIKYFGTTKHGKD